jgi:hypothetical protein
MDVSTAAGISAEYSASRTAQQLTSTFVKQQAQAEAAIGEMVEQVAKSAPATAGQGQLVDKNV